MCVVSMVGDFYKDKWSDRDWLQQPITLPHTPGMPRGIPSTSFVVDESKVTREEFDALKKEVLEMKELLKRAKQYDIDNGEPECELEEKIALIKKVAEFVGVEIDIK